MKLKDSWTTGIEKVGIRRVRGAGYTLTTLPFPQAGTATHQEGSLGLPSLQCEKETQGRHQTLLTLPGGPLRSYLTGITRGVCGAWLQVNHTETCKYAYIIAILLDPPTWKKKKILFSSILVSIYLWFFVFSLSSKLYSIISIFSGIIDYLYS